MREQGDREGEGGREREKRESLVREGEMVVEGRVKMRVWFRYRVDTQANDVDRVAPSRSLRYYSFG
jgi:hypothetical protein